MAERELAALKPSLRTLPPRPAVRPLGLDSKLGPLCCPIVRFNKHPKARQLTCHILPVASFPRITADKYVKLYFIKWNIPCCTVAGTGSKNWHTVVWHNFTITSGSAMAEGPRDALSVEILQLYGWVTQNLQRVTWRNHAPFRDGLLSVDWD